MTGERTDHGSPRLEHAAHSPATVAQVFRSHRVNGVAPRSVLPLLRHLSGPFSTAVIDGVPANRSALLSRADDGRRLVDEVHRCARGLAEVLVPLVLPAYAGSTGGHLAARAPSPART